MTTTKREAVVAALSLAEDVDAGKIDPGDLEAAAVAECRELFAEVIGPDDPLWPTQVEVTRQVLSKSGLPADELSEWHAVARSRAGGAEVQTDPARPAESI